MPLPWTGRSCNERAGEGGIRETDRDRLLSGAIDSLARDGGLDDGNVKSAKIPVSRTTRRSEYHVL
jgi:hypothetical protein